jgi:hypothetical protein
LIDEATIESLDHVLWLRSGTAASVALCRSQSTISRHVRETLSLFDLTLVRRLGDQHLEGDTTLLLLERRVQQLYRLRFGRRLRLEAGYWWRQALEAAPPPGWRFGTFDHVGPHRPLQLLRERVIDAWLYADPDLPDDDPDLLVLRFSEGTPLLTAVVGHPLHGQGRLSLDDCRAFPSLALPAGVVPGEERVWRGLGFWTATCPMPTYRAECWEGRCGDGLTLGYGWGLGVALEPRLRPLPVEVPLRFSDALVLRRDVAHELQAAGLLRQLQSLLTPLLDGPAGFCLLAA